MQDFTNADKDLPVTANLPATDSVTPNAYGGIYDKPKPRKIGFIEARKNSDNFWNLMFWVGMVSGIALTSMFDSLFDSKLLSGLSIWSTIIGVPLVVKWQTRLTFDEEKGFFSKDGRCLINSYPKKFGLALFAAMGITAFLGSVLDKSAPNLNDILSRLLIFGTFFFVITLYFILINCPIAILFSKHAWSTRSDNQLSSSYEGFKHSESTTSLNNLYSNPVNSWYSGNIYHKK